MLRDLFAPRAPDGETQDDSPAGATSTDGELPVPLRTAAVRVLDDWDAIRSSASGSGISGIVAVRSSTRPLLLNHLATGLAGYLGVPLLGTVGPAAGRESTDRHDVNSAMRLAGVEKRLVLELAEDALSGLEGKSILLVDDYTDSGWTLTVAARLLREAGTGAVHPFVLAVR